MVAAVFNGPLDLKVEEYSTPSIKADEILIKVHACGVCGTDFHIYQGKAPAQSPVIIGHEFAGIVIEKGSSVTEYKPGDMVAVNPNIHCGYCRYCKKGKVNLCLNLKALGVTVNGGFAQLCAVPVSQAYLIKNSIPLVHAAFSEPLSCCIHGINKASIKQGDSVVIIGAGTIGLLMLQLAKLKGAEKVIVLELSEEKRKLAQKLGADITINPEEEDYFIEILELTHGGADIVIECVGSENAVMEAFNIAGKGASIVIFGLADDRAKIELMLQKFFHKELKIKSSLLNPFTFQTAVDLLCSGKIRVDSFKKINVPLIDSNLRNLFNEPRDSTVIKYLIIPNS